MMKIKKGYSLRIVCLIVAGILLLNSNTVGIESHQKKNLRNPLMGDEDEARSEIVIEVLAAVKLVEVKMEIKSIHRELPNLFEEILSPLKNGNVTVERIRALFSPENEKRVYKLIARLQRLLKEKYIFEGDADGFSAKEMYVISSPDSGLCTEISESIKIAMENIGLSPEIKPVFITQTDSSKWELHRYIAVKGSNGRDIAIDAASGQFTQKNIGHIIVDLAENYQDIIQTAVDNSIFARDPSIAWGRKETYKRFFPELRAGFLRQLMKSTIATHTNL